MKKVTLLGFICLAAMLVAMSFAACAQQAAAPTTVTSPPVTVTVTATPQAKAPTFTVLDPRSYEPPRPYQGLTPRLTTLEGKKIIVVNLRGGNEQAILSVGPALQKAVPSAQVTTITSGNPWSVLPTEWDMFKTYDAVIFGHDY